MKKWHQISLVIMVFCPVFIVYFTTFDISFTGLKIRADQLHILAQQYYWFVVCMYILLFFISSLFFLPLNALLLISAGFLFSFWAVFIWANIGFCLGSLWAMLMVRYLIGNWIQTKYNHKLQNLNQKIETYGAPFLVFIQLLPITPTPLVNISVGFTTISWWTFLWTTFVGAAIGNGIFVYAGQFLYEIEAVQDILSWPLIIMLFVVALLAIIPLFFSKYLVR